jgi:hypothetical protein
MISYRWNEKSCADASRWKSNGDGVVVRAISIPEYSAVNSHTHTYTHYRKSSLKFFFSSDNFIMIK